MSNLTATNWRKWIPFLVFTTLTFFFGALPAVRESTTFTYWSRWPWHEAATALRASYRPDDAVLLRTGFVEADQLASGEVDAETAS